MLLRQYFAVFDDHGTLQAVTRKGVVVLAPGYGTMRQTIAEADEILEPDRQTRKPVMARNAASAYEMGLAMRGSLKLPQLDFCGQRIAVQPEEESP